VIVCIEDLQVQNMTRSAAGTLEHPGRRVRGKSGLNRSILDHGWGEFRRQLEYKLKWNGGILIAVAPQNADLVGALNVLARGHRVAACRDT
jgi:putative transposase